MDFVDQGFSHGSASEHADPWHPRGRRDSHRLGLGFGGQVTSGLPNYGEGIRPRFNRGGRGIDRPRAADPGLRISVLCRAAVEEH